MAISESILKEIFIGRTGLLSEEEFHRLAGVADENRVPLDRLLMERAFVSPCSFLKLLGTIMEHLSQSLLLGVLIPKRSR